MNLDTARPTLSPLHRLWRLLPADQRRRAFSSATALLAPRPDRQPPMPQSGIVIAGEFSRPSGLGEAARQMRAALTAIGVTTWSIDTDTREIPDLPEGAPLLIHANGAVLPYTLLRLPYGLARGRRIIGYWAWELPKVPDTWRPALGFVHDIWTLSGFTRDAIATLLPAGSPITLRTIPIPLAATPPQPSGLRRADFGLPEDAVVVLTSFSLASSFVRKNPLGAIAAFRAAFGDRTDRQLVLKVTNPEHYPNDLASLRTAIGDAANIRLFTMTLPRADAHALTAAADIVLSLHRSEGFGLIPAEAMLLGVPVIATGWSGNLDFMDETSAVLVPFVLVPARDPRGVYESPGTVWAEPDTDAAAAQLRRLADDPAGRAALARRGKTMATARLGLDPVRAAVGALGLRAAA